MAALVETLEHIQPAERGFRLRKAACGHSWAEWVLFAISTYRPESRYPKIDRNTVEDVVPCHRNKHPAPALGIAPFVCIGTPSQPRYRKNGHE
jgi:hypothetical protein